MVERIEPSRCPAAPDVHHSFYYPVYRWDEIIEECDGMAEDELPDDYDDRLQKEITEELEGMIEEVREAFRDKIATLRVKVTRPDDTGSDALDDYYIHLIASLGDIKCPSRTHENCRCELAACCAVAPRLSIQRL
jgi:hypothetical protein